MTWAEWQAELQKWQEDQRALDKEYAARQMELNHRWTQLYAHKPEEPCPEKN